MSISDIVSWLPVLAKDLAFIAVLSPSPILSYTII